MDFVFQIYEASVLYRDKGFKHFLYRHDPVAYRNLTLFTFEAREVLHVQVKQPRTCLVNRLHHIRAGANRMANVYSAPDAGILTLHRL